ncbi:hypothetical protein Pla110_40960 [Polystyrenella longa]|uniref:Uncharacterized protein n=1 Tax=Polystyrenella longa TaxID=2528007 RepID=A0A518CSY3_9PLAN|nr:hypothetical protein [Polystyrenella longa]QDU82341.1 hypothetical protein Pla110_40960 [Polystyrenella longa]
MTDSPQMSRREWFRLCLPKEKTPQATSPPTPIAPSDENMGHDTHALREVPPPVNHDGMDLSELPPMREAILDAPQVSQLFADLGAFASDIQLIQRTSATARPSLAKATSVEQLKLALQSLLQQQVQRLQVRYQWQNFHWIDTLESKPEGYRLVRIRHQSL